MKLKFKQSKVGESQKSSYTQSVEQILGTKVVVDPRTTTNIIQQMEECSDKTGANRLIVTSGRSVSDVLINNDKPQLLKSKVLTANTETKYVQLHANLKRCLYCSQNLFNSSTAKSILT